MNHEPTAMKPFARRIAAAAALIPTIAGLTSCDTSGTSVDSGYYYSSGSYDPWYYGGYYDDPDIIAIPPGGRPDGPARPAHPIARPPMGGPRPMPRGGGGGRRR